MGLGDGEMCRTFILMGGCVEHMAEGSFTMTVTLTLWFKGHLRTYTQPMRSLPVSLHFKLGCCKVKVLPVLVGSRQRPTFFS